MAALGGQLRTASRRLTYGGWGGGWHGGPPTITFTVLAALLGVGVHFLDALPDLVGDNQNGVRSAPLRVALKIGALKLLWLAGTSRRWCSPAWWWPA